MENKESYNKLVKSRNELVLNHPFFASLALRLEMVEDSSCRTAWTDGKTFGYNPSYIEKLSINKLVGLCAHTVMHPALGHHKRRNGREADTWNRACDYSINWILLEAGLTLPDGYLFSEEFIGKTADYVYDIIYAGEEERSDKEFVSQRNEEGEASIDTDKKKSDSGDNSEEGEENELNSKPEVGEENIQDAGDPGMSGEVRDSSGEEGEFDSDEETDWDIVLAQAALHARGIGKMPAGLERLIEKKFNPKLPWNELLSRFIENSASSDYSFLQPNRRFIHQNIYFPSLKNSELPEIVITIDSSGSVSPIEIDQFAAEISGILETLPSKIHIMSADMKVNTFDSITKEGLPFHVKPVGGGGTDFRPAFERTEAENIMPSCFIYLTDLNCKKFPEEPGYPVLWVKTGNEDITPPFGEVIEMEL